MKRLGCSLAVGTALAIASPALAVPESLKCPEGDLKAVDCIRDDIFIMDGKTPGFVIPAVGTQIRKGCTSGSFASENVIRWNCFFDYAKIEEHFRAVLKAKNVQPATWDELVIFTVDSDEPGVFGGTTEPMLFYRTGGADGVNEVEGIGLKVTPRTPAVPYAGYVVGGSTTTFSIWQPPRNGAVPKNLKWWPLPDPAGVPGREVRFRNCNENALCNDGFTGYQALSQVSSQLFGPSLRQEPELEAPDNWYAYKGTSRSLCNPVDLSNGPAVPVSLVPPDGGVGDAASTPPPFTIPTGGKQLLDLSQMSGTRIAAGPTEPLRYGEPAMTVCPDIKSSLVNSITPPYVVYDFVKGPQPRAAGVNFGKIRPRIWNSFIDLDGALMGGGSNWKENGNGTATSGGPDAFQVASPPYRGQRIVVFHPLELWLMGFAPADGIKMNVYESNFDDVVGPPTVTTRGFFLRDAGPRMGIPKLIPIGKGGLIMTIRSEGKRQAKTLTEMLGAPPARKPDFAMAPHKIRQMWVVVTKPEDKLLANEIANDDCAFENDLKKSCDTGRLDTINAEGVEHMIRWRRAWQQQFYMYTGYTGRMVTNFDQDFDDSAYWEFIQKEDDQKTFTKGGGLEFFASGPRKDLTSSAILSYANISTPGKEGTMTFTPHMQQLPTRIDGRVKERYVGCESDKVDNDGNGMTDEAGEECGAKFVVAGDNALLVRMALPKRDPAEAKNIKAEATLNLTNGSNLGPSIRIPGDKNSFLVFDGKFHTYAVDLRKVDGYLENTFNGFSFVPSSVAINCKPEITQEVRDEDLECVKLDYIRFANIPDPDDAGDFDEDCDGSKKQDGYIGLEDNCPKLYNPGQEDADGNGIGDDCEDFDLDAIVNRCDNCPTVTNARQGNRDEKSEKLGEKLGDACDEDYRGGCFLQPDSIAGTSGNPAVIPLALLGLALTGVFAGRLKRRRRR